MPCPSPSHWAASDSCVAHGCQHRHLQRPQLTQQPHPQRRKLMTKMTTAECSEHRSLTHSSCEPVVERLRGQPQDLLVLPLPSGRIPHLLRTTRMMMTTSTHRLCSQPVRPLAGLCVALLPSPVAPPFASGPTLAPMQRELCRSLRRWRDQRGRGEHRRRWNGRWRGRDPTTPS